MNIQGHLGVFRGAINTHFIHINVTIVWWCMKISGNGSENSHSERNERQDSALKCPESYCFNWLMLMWVSTSKVRLFFPVCASESLWIGCAIVSQKLWRLISWWPVAPVWNICPFGHPLQRSPSLELKLCCAPIWHPTPTQNRNQFSVESLISFKRHGTTTYVERTGADPGFWSGGVSGVLNEPKICSK